MDPNVQHDPHQPEIAHNADDLEEIKKAVDDAAAVSGGLWLSYLLVLFYLAVAAGAVSHSDLLLENRVKLPFLNIELPLRAFFLLAPFLFLVTHAYALVHFNMLGRKAWRFHTELTRQVPDKEVRDKLRSMLPSNIFVQLLAGPPELRAGVFGAILKLIAWTTLVLFPILLLLLLQIQFLPYHDETITWAQRIALVLDVFLLWILRPPPLPGGARDDRGASVRAWVSRSFWIICAGLLSLTAIWLSLVIATIPDEWQEIMLAKLDPAWWPSVSENSAGERVTKLISMRELLFAGSIDETTRRRRSWFSNTLVLPAFNLYQALNVDDPKKLDWKDHLIDLRGRHLEKAILSDATLSRADLTGADLEGALLDRTRLQGASLDNAHLQGASLDDARLAGASLRNVWLQGASLSQTQLQGSMLDGAQLQGATLGGVELEGASIKLASLQGAYLEGAQLQGATLVGTQLQGASLVEANIAAADFSGSELWRIKTDDVKADTSAPIKLEGVRWLPENGFHQPWSEESYQILRQWLTELLQGDALSNALSRIDRLDCNNPDSSLLSCGYKRFDWITGSVAQPEAVTNLNVLATSDDYTAGLANVLLKLVCADNADALYILRGLTDNDRLAEVGDELVDTIDSPKCPVAALLTFDDKARLHADQRPSAPMNCVGTFCVGPGFNSRP